MPYVKAGSPMPSWLYLTCTHTNTIPDAQWHYLCHRSLARTQTWQHTILCIFNNCTNQFYKRLQAILLLVGLFRWGPPLDNCNAAVCIRSAASAAGAVVHSLLQSLHRPTLPPKSSI
jgi:hypothetical protein